MEAPPAAWVVLLALGSWAAAWALIRWRGGPDRLNWLGAMIAAGILTIVAVLVAALFGISPVAP